MYMSGRLDMAWRGRRGLGVQMYSEDWVVVVLGRDSTVERIEDHGGGCGGVVRAPLGGSMVMLRLRMSRVRKVVADEGMKGAGKFGTWQDGGFLVCSSARG